MVCNTKKYQNHISKTKWYGFFIRRRNTGLHYPESRFYTRRIRLSVNSELVEPLKKGYKIEPAFGSEDSTLVVEVPVDVGEGIRTASELSIWEQFSLKIPTKTLGRQSGQLCCDI